MSDHAKLGPSSADRWMQCPGSVVISEGMPQRSSEFAVEGTQAHELAEKLLRGEKAVGEIDMVENVMLYVDHVFELAESDAKNTLHVEIRVKVSDDIWGTADAIVWEPKTKTLYVRDLKYGAGVAVEVEGNLQLKIYALAALLTMAYPARTVNVGIVQPRCSHRDGYIREVSFDVVDLIDFHAELVDAALRVKDAHQNLKGSDFKPTEKGCRWCLAAPKCPALAAKAQSVSKLVFAPGLPYDPKQLADTLDFLPILEGWIKNTREFAYAEAEKGNAIPKWKLVAKRATRKWKNEAAAEKVLAEVLDTSVLVKTTRTILTPAEVEKLLAKDQKPMLAELVIAESSGHTLVHESDKRDAIRVDAKAAFS